MRSVIVRPEAEVDIEDIADHTIGEWGHEQARKYVGGLRRAVEALATGALRYPLYEQIVPGLRRKRSAMHHIYYLTFADRVEIVRIIHVQRDPGLHLKVETWRNDD